MKKFFNKIVLFLGTLFTNLDEWIHDHVQPSIEMVERIKAVVASPVGNLIAALIPGGVGEAVRDELIDVLTKAIDAMHVTTDILLEPDWTNKVSKTITYIRTLSKPMQDAIYHKLASEMAKIKSGTDSFKGHSVDLLVQMQYSKHKEGVWADDLPNETIVNGEVQTPLATTPAATQQTTVVDQAAAAPVAPVAEPVQAQVASIENTVSTVESVASAVVDAVAPNLAAPLANAESVVSTVENTANAVVDAIAPTPVVAPVVETQSVAPQS